jgi:hypothetical protein
MAACGSIDETFRMHLEAHGGGVGNLPCSARW